MNSQLNMLDATFLYFETKHSPMHIAGLQILEVPLEKRHSYFAELQRHIAERAPAVPFMTRRLAATPLDVDHPHWETMRSLDIHHHVRRIFLPKPGSIAQLEAAVGELHAEPLDRSKPLWRYYLIEGVDGNKAAWYTKMHHACIDGVAGQILLDVFGNPTPDDSPIGPKAPDVTAPDFFGRWARAAAESAIQPLNNMLTATEGLRSLGRLARRALAGESFGAYTNRAPRTRFNCAIGPQRTYTVGTLSLAEVKAVGKRFDCKVNDVFLAVCAGGLRKYLSDLHELPAEPLIAAVPVSLREPGDRSLNNQVTMLLASLETHRADPLARLSTIRDSALAGKAIAAATSRVMPQDMHVLGLPVAMRSGAAAMEALRMADALTPPVNLIISNVPGPRHEVFIHGARMLTHYPVSAPAHGNALNITVQSYQNRLDFGITACRNALADGAKLRDDLLAAWHELKALALPVEASSSESEAETMPHRSAA